jgi:hypothetical protein
MATSSASNMLKRIFTKSKKKEENPKDAAAAEFKYPKPDSIQQLEAMVWKANVPCTCDICQPQLYGKKNCSRPKHLTITLSENLEFNKYGRIVYSPPKIEPLAVVLPELMHLARTMIQYFDRPWEYLND